MKTLITLGDPNGIGAEITAKALLHSKTPSDYEIIGIPSSWDPYSHLFPDTVFHSVLSDYTPQYGKVSSKAGEISLKSLDRAIELLKYSEYKGLVTAPLSKEAVTLAYHKDFIGHTNYLAEAFDCQTEMVFWSAKWSVLLMTVHSSLRDSLQQITVERFRIALQNTILFHKQHYHNGEILVCGLNPHAGENGLMGKEELEIFAPIIQEFQQQGEPIRGIFPPDTIFMNAEKSHTPSTILAPTHDLGLIPFKLLHFHDGVNVTMGLPFIRTSPDHGTAFDIAGKNCANPQAMISALNFIEKTFN